jgi:predicted site-specific integrase-resolvase
MKWKNSIIGKHIKSKAYSLKDLCEYLNITENILRNWLNQGYVSLPHIRKVSEMCDIPLNSLIKEREQRK